MDFCDDANLISSLYLSAALFDATSRQIGRGPLWVDKKPYCRKCGEKILQARVEAIPETELCIDCAEEISDGN